MNLSESEKTTRKKRIDSKLASSLLNWKVIPWSSGLDTDFLTAHAVEEYPTKSGPADYALFVNGKLLGIIEAKKLSVGAGNVLEQAKRYSKSAAKTVGEWRGYKVPFLYSTNGEVIFHLDIRKKENTSCQLSDFHSPQALSDKFSRDTVAAELWFRNNPVNKIKKLRSYQEEAIEAIENALIGGKKKMLLAMATGTGKTFTIVSLIYRLLKSGYAKKILFLVDRRALAAQAVSAISAFETPEGIKLDNDYEVYSQRFRREDLEEGMRFNPEVLPEDYLTNPQEKHTFIYVSTIQRMAVNLLGKKGLDGFEYDVDAGKLDIPINAFDVIVADECHRGYSAKETGTWKRVLDYFDAVKIGLTATPAGHTMAMFTHKVSSYSTEQAVLDGFLVDYDAVKIKSGVKINGAFLKEGELVGEVDTQTGVETMDELEDEREFSARRIEVSITAPDSTKKIIKALKKHVDRFEDEYGRFPKILIFAVNDLPHISHADEIVRTCKDVFGKGDDFVVKITGSKTVDRPLQKIRQFRNRPEPGIVVTVDMLSTGVDIPAIEFIVFLRMVKSRILWVQMLGRGTRRCDEIHKDKFTIVDCFDGSLIEYFKNATDFDVSLQKETIPISQIIERIYDNRDREYNVKVLVKRLRRIEKKMGSEAIDEFSKYIPNGDLQTFTDGLKDNLEKNFIDTMKLLRDEGFQHLLENYKRSKKPFLRAYEVVDTVEDEVLFRKGSDYQKPEDYLKSFETFVKENSDKIKAIEILLNRPAGWNKDVLEDLIEKLKMNDFDEKELQRAHNYVSKKSLADIISIIKYAADFKVPVLTARERVERALDVIAGKHDFSEDQLKWLSYIKEHLTENLAVSKEDFEGMPVFERHGGLGIVKQVFGNNLDNLIHEINTAIAA